MGIYVSKPVTDKDSCDEEYTFIKCGSSSMQGWRTAQEDAHNAILEYGKDCSFFAVYDGHGGHEVAEYCAAHLPDHLLNNTFYKEGNYKQALIDAFLTFDAHLLQPEAMTAIKKIARSKKGEADCESTDSEDPEEVTVLRREADMPIDEVLASNYSEIHACAARLQEGEPATVGSSALRPKRIRRAPLDDDSSLDDNQEPSATSNNSNSTDNSTRESDTLISDKKDVLNSSKSSDSKVNSNGDVTKPDKVVVNGEIEKCSVQSECSDVRTDSEAKVNGEVKEHSGDGVASNGKAEDKTQLVVEGRRIVPTTLSTTVVGKGEEQGAEAPSYTGKGKSGGKGGKVKGASAITTTTQDAEPKAGRPRRAALADAKRKVLSGEDIDSEEDEDEEDETFALDGAEDDEMDELDEEADSTDEEEPTLADAMEGVADEEEEDDEEEEGEEESDSDDEEPMYNAEDVDVYNEFSATMRDGPGFDSGCTACVALLHSNTLLVANVGDSRCVVSRAGKAIEMSLDHKPEDTIETDRIVKAGGKVTADGRVNGGLNLSRAFGDHGYKQNTRLSPSEQMISPLPDVKLLSLCQQDDFVIIACDGIWNSLSSQQAVDFVCERLKEDPDVQLSTVCEQMFEHCLAPNLDGDGTGCDNMTCIIFSFKDKKAFPPTASDEPEVFELPAPLKSSDDHETTPEGDSSEDSKDKVSLAVAANGSQVNGSSGPSPADHKEGEEGVEVAVKKESGVNGSSEQKSAVKRTAEESGQSGLPDDRPGKKAKLELASPAV